MYENIPWQLLLSIASTVYAFLRWKVKNKQTETTIFDVVQTSGQEIAETERELINRIDILEKEILLLKKKPNASRRKGRPHKGI